MTLQQMEYIVALDKYRHFVLAAESCGVTQPTLSALIQKLEEELDVKIFNRDRKQVTPTDIGEKIIRQARTALNEAYRIREVVADETSTTNGNLRIGILPTIAPYLVPDLIHHFRKSFPNVNLFIDEKENESLVKDLELGNIDMAITTLPESSKGLFSKGEIPAEQIWILKEGHCLPHSGLNLCKNGQFGNHIYQAGSIETLIRIVDKNGGYTIIPELHLRFLNDKQKEKVLPLQVNPPAQRQVSLLVKEDFVRERMMQAVLDVLQQIIPEEMMDNRIKKHAVRLR